MAAIMIGDPLDICIGITNELYHVISSEFKNELRCWSAVDSFEEDGSVIPDGLYG